ncbi:MAG: HAD hydrolase family protein, partial [Verrucomicrobiales bacterium]|nr:HAD hydrolase family protein [Verrucomicrobiales bacterium]
NSRFFDSIRGHISANTSARYFDTPQEPSCIVANNVPEMDAICAFLDERVADIKNLSYERNSVYLRFSHSAYNKGLTLTELTKQLGLPTDRIFTAGDNHNDTSMLHPNVAGMVACPSNAVPEVKESVAGHGGYVAARPGGQGTLEALQHFFGDLGGSP